MDFHSATVRLEPGTAKNDEAGLSPLTDELRSVLEAQKAKAQALRKDGMITSWVFHRNGKPILHTRCSLKTASKTVGIHGRIVHDLRRTAVRNLQRARVPRSVAMKMTGHKTESVYRRYDIVSKADLAVVAQKLNAYSMGKVTGKVGDLAEVGEAVSA